MSERTRFMIINWSIAIAGILILGAAMWGGE